MTLHGGEMAGEGSSASERILVVEDDSFSRNLLLQLLATQGYRRVELAADGHQALDRLRQGGIDLMLLDIEMPELDGIEVLRRMKDIPSLAPIPVIVISAVEGVQSQTPLLMRALQRMKVPTLIFVNKTDRAGADPDRVLREISDRLTLSRSSRPQALAGRLVRWRRYSRANPARGIRLEGYLVVKVPLVGIGQTSS